MAPTVPTSTSSAPALDSAPIVAPAPTATPESTLASEPTPKPARTPAPTPAPAHSLTIPDSSSSPHANPALDPATAPAPHSAPAPTAVPQVDLTPSPDAAPALVTRSAPALDSTQASIPIHLSGPPAVSQPEPKSEPISVPAPDVALVAAIDPAPRPASGLASAPPQQVQMTPIDQGKGCIGKGNPSDIGGVKANAKPDGPTERVPEIAVPGSKDNARKNAEEARGVGKTAPSGKEDNSAALDSTRTSAIKDSGNVAQKPIRQAPVAFDAIFLATSTLVQASPLQPRGGKWGGKDSFISGFLNTLKQLGLTTSENFWEETINSSGGDYLVDLLKSQIVTVLIPKNDAFDPKDPSIGNDPLDLLSYSTIFGSPEDDFKITNSSLGELGSLSRRGAKQSRSAASSGLKWPRRKRWGGLLDNNQAQIVDQFSSTTKKRWNEGPLILIDRPVGSATVVSRSKFKNIIILVIDTVLTLPKK
ncbi:hypothetical protein FRC06_010325, partial [Ceratobasidium sp. 370]